MENFAIGDAELSWLKSRDARLCGWIESIPKPERALTPDPFRAMTDSIIGQQISGAAAKSISEKLLRTLGGNVTPEAILSKTDEEIAGCGLGKRKASYIRALSHAAAAGEMDKIRLEKLSDSEVIRKLMAYPGVGEWTAQMFLIFCLERKDVFSVKDFGIRRGVMNLYGLPELTAGILEECRKRYSPFGTIASFYLWEAARQPVLL